MLEMTPSALCSSRAVVSPTYRGAYDGAWIELLLCKRLWKEEKDRGMVGPLGLTAAEGTVQPKGVGCQPISRNFL